MTQIRIRPITPEDEGEWRDLWSAYLSFYKTSVPEEVYRTTFRRLCDSQNTAQQGLLAIQDGIPAGLVHFIFHPHNWRVEEVCYLQDLYADRAVRGQGIGRALIEAVYKSADNRGCPSVYWMTQEFNETARLLYDRIGTLTPFIKYQR